MVPLPLAGEGREGVFENRKIFWIPKPFLDTVRVLFCFRGVAQW